MRKNFYEIFGGLLYFLGYVAYMQHRACVVAHMKNSNTLVTAVSSNVLVSIYENSAIWCP